MTPHDAREKVLVDALAAGLTHDQAAAVAGCSRSTLDRRLRQPAFSERVQQARAARVQRVTDALGALSEQAVTVLAELLSGGKEQTRARVALAIPGLAADHREQTELEARMTALEAALAQAPASLQVAS